MSYDVDLVIDTGGEYPPRVVEVGNYTWNVRPMHVLAFAAAGRENSGVQELDGMACIDARPLLETAVAHMDDPSNRETYEKLNPSNGWGDFEGAREFLRRIMQACVEHPKCSIRVW